MLSDIEFQKHRRKMNLQTLVKAKPFRQEVTVTNMEAGGGQIKNVEGTLSVPAHRGLYVFLSDCGHLQSPGGGAGENKVCSAYETRPEACRAFEVGSAPCLGARAKFGLDGHEAAQPLHRDEPLIIKNWQAQN